MTENLKKFSWLKKLFASTFVLLMLLSMLAVPASASSTVVCAGQTDKSNPAEFLAHYERFFKIWNSNTYLNVPTITGYYSTITTPKETMVSGQARLIFRESQAYQY